MVSACLTDNAREGRGRWMLPPLTLRACTGAAIVDEQDLTREVDAAKIDDLVDAFQERGRLGDDDGDDAEMREGFRSLIETTVGGLHAEFLVLIEETSELRAQELLSLAEKALIRILGGVVVARIDVNVITAQKQTSAKLNLFEGGVRLAAQAYGLGSTPLLLIEDFLSARAAAEFEMLLLRFGGIELARNTKLDIQLEATNRMLGVQRAA